MITLILLAFIVACICSVNLFVEAFNFDQTYKPKFEFSSLELALFCLSLNIAVGLGIHLAYIVYHYFSR